MTGTERERATEAEEVVSFYEILLASVHEALQSDGTTKSTLVKAVLNPLFVKGVLQANKRSKATKAMQDIVEETIASLSTHDNRFAAACNLIPPCSTNRSSLPSDLACGSTNTPSLTPTE